MARWTSGLLLLLAVTGCAPGASSVRATTPAAGPTDEPQRFVSPYAYEQFVRAELARARGELPRAIEAYRATLAGAEEDAYVLSRLASALAEGGDEAEAQELLARALALDPFTDEAWLVRAELAERRGDAAAAYEALERAESAEPASPRAPLALSRLLSARGHQERARAVRDRYEARTFPGFAGAAVTPHATRVTLPEPRTLLAEQLEEHGLFSLARELRATRVTPRQ